MGSDSEVSNVFPLFGGNNNQQNVENNNNEFSFKLNQVVTCDSCAQNCDRIWHDDYESYSIVNGMQVAISSGYCEFFDDIDNPIWELNLCHDCALRIFRFFVASNKYAFLKENHQDSAHCSMSETKCCEFGFQLEE